MNDSLKLVRQLVEDFRSNEAAYLSPAYLESQIRQDYIDKLFTALGWDVTHERQKNPYEQEVKIENKVKTSGSQRRADYAFFIAPNFRDVKFFVEAKKPSRNLANLDDYYQTIRYGWNSNTPIAVLTDFEELHILDCRHKPDKAAALERKIEVFHYSDFADEETFARIFYLIGREAVAHGSLEKRAAALPKPRGKAKQKGMFKGGYQQVDEAFLVALDGYRNTLAHAFKAKNPHLGGEELTEAVQRTLDRLVFIRFLEDKDIEEPTIIDFRSKPSAWSAFAAYCKSLEPKYNGLIFKQHLIIDSAGFVPPDGGKFAEICDELSDPASPYDFDKIPISILGSIYERFLGKVVSATEKRVKVVEKPEVRKAGGVYYTPEYIVRYIVKETVGKMIEGKSPDQIATMAFADIACGSGSFLLEVYDTLLEYHRKWYNANPQKAKKADVEERDGQLTLSLKKRQEILTNNIYGVDIDFQATEVTQLSLYLKLLEDVTLTQLHLFKEKVLPDLRRNIVCGNSLIEPDIESETSLFPGANDSPLERGKSSRSRDDRGVSDMDALKPMRFTDAFPDVMARGGFDAIVGNPPYVRQEQLSELKAYFQKQYAVFHGTADLYAYFIERGISLLRHGGFFSYIVANKWFRTNYAQPLRKWLKEKHIEEIIDFGDLPVFEGATTYPCIIRVRKGEKPSSEFQVGNVESLDALDLHSLIQQKGYSVNQLKLDDSGWSLSKQSIQRLLDKLRKVGISLDEYTASRVFRGIITGLNGAFVISDDTRKKLIEDDSQCSKLIMPFLSGKEVKRYDKLKETQYLIFIPSGWTSSNSTGTRDKWKWLQKQYPAIANHLSAFQELARKRYDQGEYWWELRACDYYDAFRAAKIIYPNICKRPEFTFDETGLYTNQKCFIIPSDDKYLLAILNSSVTYFLFRTILPKLRGGFYEPSYIYFKDFPIRTINFEDPAEKQRHDHIVNLVEQMLAAKSKLSHAKTDAEVNRLELQCESLDRQIDAAVYELYGLTEEEIKIIES